MTKEVLFDYVKGHKLAVLASVEGDGHPQAALVGIAVTPDLEIVFDTLTTSRKYQNLIAHPRVALVIGCTGDKTLQLEGIAREPAGEELKHYRSVYFATWTDGPSRLTWPGICHIVVKPKWARFSDYGETPASIEEMQF